MWQCGCCCKKVHWSAVWGVSCWSHRVATGLLYAISLCILCPARNTVHVLLTLSPPSCSLPLSLQLKYVIARSIPSPACYVPRYAPRYAPRYVPVMPPLCPVCPAGPTLPSTRNAPEPSHLHPGLSRLVGPVGAYRCRRRANHRCLSPGVTKPRDPIDAVLIAGHNQPCFLE